MEAPVAAADVVEQPGHFFTPGFVVACGQGAGLLVERGGVVGGLEFEADEVDAAGSEFEGVEGFRVGKLAFFKACGGAGIGNEGDGPLGVEAEFGEDGANYCGPFLTRWGKGIYPEIAVFGVVEASFLEQGLNVANGLLGLVDLPVGSL